MFMIPFKHDADFSQVLSVFNQGSAFSESDYAPSLDVKESAEAYTVLADLPGVDKKDIEVKVEEGLLSIAGSRKSEHEQESPDRTWHRVERSWGSFRRSLRLGEGVDPSKVSATYADGVLTVSVPKKEGSLPRTVEVR